MTDQLTGLPAADWYTDPSDPASERWWGGLEWTNHTRPLDVAPPAPAPPQFALPAAAAPPAPQLALSVAASAPAPAAPASPLALPAAAAPVAVPVATTALPAQPAAPVPAPAFAALLAATAPSMFETQPAAPTFSPSQFASAEEASEVASWVGGLTASTGSPWENRTPTPAPAPSAAFVFGTQAAQPAQVPPTAQSAQPATAPVAVPTRTHHAKTQSNTPAVVGFVLSLLGLGLIALIVSARGVRKARHFQSLGEAATGLVLARLGVAISIVTTVVGLIVGALFAYSLYFAGSIGFLDDLLASTGIPTSEISTVSDTTSADQVAAVAIPTADRIASSMAGSVQLFYGMDADSVVCPVDAAYAPGGVVTCDIVLADGRQLSGVQTFTDHGWTTEYIAK